MYNIPIVIPSYEPDERLLKLLEDLKENEFDKVIIVDDGSGIEYRHIFKEAKKKYSATVLRHSVNQGKGRALKTAFNYLLSEEKDMIGCVTADSDGQHSIEDIRKVMSVLSLNKDSLILGSRDFSLEGVPDKSRKGNTITSVVMNFLYGIRISDTQTGLRGIPRDFMEKLLCVDGERFEFETNMLIACKGKVNIIEVPIETIYDSKEDHKTHFNPIKDSIRIYKLFGKRIIVFVVGFVCVAKVLKTVVKLVFKSKRKKSGNHEA